LSCLVYSDLPVFFLVSVVLLSVDVVELLLLLPVVPEPPEEYPSAYQPPPFRSNEQRDKIFLARLWQQGQEIDLVPSDTKRSVTVPLGHSNS
jgi:hypothetical protein